MADISSRITIRTVADAAGVSVTTVDRVLNGRSNVHPRTVARVLDSVEKLKLLPDTSTSTERQVVVVVPSGPNPFHDDLANALQGELAQVRGIAGKVQRTAMFNVDELVDRLDEAGETAKAIAFVPFDHPAVRESAQRLIDKNIPVFLLLSGLSMREPLPYIGQDNRSAGRTAGFLLGQMLTGRTGTIAVMAGNLGFRAHEEREMGFRSVLREEFPDLQLTATLESGDNPEVAHSIITNFLKDPSEIVGFYNVGGSTEKVQEALTEHAGTQRLVTLQHDLTFATRAALIDGSLTAVVHQNTDRVARATVETLHRTLMRAEHASVSRIMPIEILTKENLP